MAVAPKDDRVFNFEFDRATTLLGITFKNVSEIPEDYPDSLPQTWLYADLMVAVSRRVGPSLPNDFGEYDIHTSDQLGVGESITYGKIMKTGGGTAVVLIHNRTEMAIEMTIGAAFGNPI